MASTADDIAGDGLPPPKKKPGRKTIILLAAVHVALIAAGVGGWFYMQDQEQAADDPRAAAAEAAHDADEPPAYVDVPEMVVNLRTGDGQSRYLKLHFTLEAANAEAVPIITERLPAVRDALQPFLRELRPEDLAGAAAVLMVKEEMLRRARRELPPETLDDVLIQTMVQQ
ncbi:MAG: hypothetical protein RIS17_354 [Pseudomonadota bacterium]